MVVGLQFSNAQQVDVQNKVEYVENSSTGDLNSIKMPVKKVKKQVMISEDVSIEDLERIASKRRAKRYRKVRKSIEKCFKEVEEDTCGEL